MLANVPATVSISAASPLSTLNRPLIVLWAVASVCWLGLLGLSAMILSRRATRWRPEVIEGVPVFVSHAMGPALMGVFTPGIVLPGWALELPRERLRLAIAHEREHASARDPLLLLAAALALAAMPWNPALWYAFARLRLAVEVDCDRRVLLAHPDVGLYGALLLDVGERTLAGATPVAALAESSSNLERRLHLMTTRPQSFASVRLIGAFVGALLFLAIACRAPRPASLPSVAGGATSRSDLPGPTVRNDSLYLQLKAMLAAWNGDQSARLSIGDSLFDQLTGMKRVMEGHAKVVFIPESTLRGGVAERFPEALTGKMGRSPFLWIVADSAGTVLRSATGRQWLSRNRDGKETLDWDAIVRRFPEVPPSNAPGGMFQWSSFEEGDVTVNVVWVRLARGWEPAGAR